MRNVERMAQFCDENSIKHLIVDIRQQESKTTTVQMFDLGTSVPKVLRAIRIAVVCQSSDREAQFGSDREAQFGETVAANRGARSRSFTTVEEAQKWLEGEDIAPNQSLQGRP
jgi:hypothetical protein